MTKFFPSQIYKPFLKPALWLTVLPLAACSTLEGLGIPSAKETAEAAQAAVSSEAAALDAPASWVFGPDTDGEIAESWTSVLVDPLLSDLIAESLERNPSLRASSETIAQSEAIIRQSRSRLLPSLSASFSATGAGALEGAPFGDRYSGGFNANWEADLWGSIDAGVLGAEFDLKATRASFEAARQSLIAAVARTYILGIEADQRIALSAQTLQAQEETHRIVRVRYELGAASRRELVLAESDVAGARDNLVVAKASKTDAVLALQALLGRYPDGSLDIASDFPTVPDRLGAGLPLDILRRRPDIVAAEQNVLSAFQTTREAEADRWPRLSLSGGVNSARNNLFDLLDPVSIAYSLGAQLVDTLFDGGFEQSRIDLVTASQRIAIANYGQSVLDAYLEVETALNDIEILAERKIYVRQAAASARETLRLSEIQYKEGAIDLIDVLTFRQRSFQSDQTAITLERLSIDAKIALYLALGGPGISPP